MADPELKGFEIQVEPVTNDTFVTHWQYWVSPDGNERSPKLRGFEVGIPGTFSDELPLAGVVKQKHSVVGHSPIIRGGAD